MLDHVLKIRKCMYVCMYSQLVIVFSFLLLTFVHSNVFMYIYIHIF